MAAECLLEWIITDLNFEKLEGTVQIAEEDICISTN